MQYSRQRARRNSHRFPATVEICEPRTLLTSPGMVLDEIPAIDGLGNNQSNPDWGSTGEQLLRMAGADYADGKSMPAGQDRPSAREISNGIVDAAGQSTPNGRYLTDVLWLWGQFIDHDIDLTGGANPAEPFHVPMPQGDPHFDPDGMGTVEMEMNRSIYEIDSGGVRQQINQITAFLDGSGIYGSDPVRAAFLRAGVGGKLKTSAGDLLPFNTGGFDNAGGPDPGLFLAGDVRANENVALSAMHTLWVREHNRIADEIADDDPSLSDEEIFQQARAMVRAELQVITYNEFLPALLGAGALRDYGGYDPSVNPGISNEFSTAAYRLGHSLLSSELLRLDENGNVIPQGNLSLQNAFFHPNELVANGIASILRGVSTNIAQELDNQIVDDVRNFLFGPPGAGGFDLASLNIQRGRDHGLSSYNDTRKALGLKRVKEFSDISSDPEVVLKLSALYDDVDDIDLWVGGLAEDHLHGSSLGETFNAIVVDQFERLRDGDRFWYENVFQGQQLRDLESTTLADVIERNAGIQGLQENVFFSPAVLYVDLSAKHGSDVTVRTTADAVEVVDNRSRQVIASRPLDEIRRLVLVGSDHAADQFTIAPIASGLLAEGIEIHAGSKKGDVLRFLGTNQKDVIQVNPHQVSVNGVVTAFTGVDRIEIETRGGKDDVQVSEDVDIPVSVDGHQVSKDHHGHHHVGNLLDELFGSHDFLDAML